MSERNKKVDRKEYAQMAIEDRIKKVECIDINFPRNEAALEAIEQCHQHAKVSGEAEGLLIQGETGAGKTTLYRRYIRDYPHEINEDGTIARVLYATVPVPATVKSLVTKLLSAIGDPAAERGSQVSQTNRLKRYLAACGTELIILDEFQHFQDRDSRKILKTVSDWLKVLMDETGVPVLLVGMPYSHTILDSEGNEQLQRRFATRINLDPFGYVTSEERTAFRKFLKAIDNKLPLAEPSNLADPDIALCFSEATDGVVAHVMKLVRRATVIALESGMERLTLEMLALAYEQRLAANDPSKPNPFVDVVKIN
jgi:type II secretory pathway predicted ATPase ExeA